MNLEQKIQKLFDDEDEGLLESMSALARVLVVNALVHRISKESFLENLGDAWDHYKAKKDKITT